MDKVVFNIISYYLGISNERTNFHTVSNNASYFLFFFRLARVAHSITRRHSFGVSYLSIALLPVKQPECVVLIP